MTLKSSNDKRQKRRHRQNIEGTGFPRLYDLIIVLATRGRQRQYRQDLVDLAGIQPGQRVLDIGCGTGSFAIAAWNQTQPGGAVSGIDVSSTMLDVARKKSLNARTGVEFFHTKATALSFRDNVFDIVTVITALHAIPAARRRACFAEIARVLKPGGKLLLVDFAGDLRLREHWIARHGAHREFDLHKYRCSLSEYCLDVVKHGNCRWMDLGYIKAKKAGIHEHEQDPPISHGGGLLHSRVRNADNVSKS